VVLIPVAQFKHTSCPKWLQNNNIYANTPHTVKRVTLLGISKLRIDNNALQHVGLFMILPPLPSVSEYPKEKLDADNIITF